MNNNIGAYAHITTQCLSFFCVLSDTSYVGRVSETTLQTFLNRSNRINLNLTPVSMIRSITSNKPSEQISNKSCKQFRDFESSALRSGWRIRRSTTKSELCNAERLCQMLVSEEFLHGMIIIIHGSHKMPQWRHVLLDRLHCCYLILRNTPMRKEDKSKQQFRHSLPCSCHFVFSYEECETCLL